MGRHSLVSPSMTNIFSLLSIKAKENHQNEISPVPTRVKSRTLSTSSDESVYLHRQRSSSSPKKITPLRDSTDSSTATAIEDFFTTYFAKHPVSRHELTTSGGTTPIQRSATSPL